MTSLWPQLEPLLAKVQKPARYIGVRGRRERPEHGAGKVAWLLVYPDTYEIGLPNQGLQILYEILNERADAVAERTYAPWARPRGAAARHGLAAVLGRHPPPGRRVRPARLQPVGRARLHERPQLHRPGRRAGAGRRPRPEHPLVGAGGHCTYNPEPLADFVDFVRARRRRGGRVARSPRSCGRGRRAVAPRARASAVLRELGHDPGRVRAVDVRGRPTTASGSSRSRRATPTCPARREAHDRRPRRLALPEAPARAAHRGRARPAQRRGLPRLHPRLPLLPGRHDHPAGARAPGRAGAHDGRRGPAPHRLRRGRAHVAVDRRLLRHRARRRRHRRTIPWTAVR